MTSNVTDTTQLISARLLVGGIIGMSIGSWYDVESTKSQEDIIPTTAAKQPSNISLQRKQHNFSEDWVEQHGYTAVSKILNVACLRVIKTNELIFMS